MSAKDLCDILKDIGIIDDFIRELGYVRDVFVDEDELGCYLSFIWDYDINVISTVLGSDSELMIYEDKINKMIAQQ